MTEERITQTETPAGETHTHTTIITDEKPSGGAGKWLIVIILLVLAGLAVLAFNQMSGAEVAKDNAVADAAGDVGDAAGQIGDAAQDAAESLGN